MWCCGGGGGGDGYKSVSNGGGDQKRLEKTGWEVGFQRCQELRES